LHPWPRGDHGSARAVGALADVVAVAGDLEHDVRALESVRLVIAAGRVHRTP
jgi:hypothetical protein